MSIEDLRARMESARDGLKTLLIAWARYEDEEADPRLHARIQATREHWGQVARDFLLRDDD